MMLSHCSGVAALQRDVPGLASIVLHPDLTVGPAYGMVVPGTGPAAARFTLFVISERGQAILARFGFHPVWVAD